jgi:predicted O-methyltransferase YrrM
MYSKISIVFRYLRYYVNASNSRGHGIHSPFVYEFITKVLNDRRPYSAYSLVGQVKKSLMRDQEKIEYTDLGAGYNAQAITRKSISSIAKTAVSSGKFGRLLFRIAHFYPVETIIELGTSLGISTAYLALGAPSALIITMEGSPEISLKANQTFKLLGLNKITRVTGNFDENITETIEKFPPAGLVFIDGNHKKEPVIAYFEKFLEKLSVPATIIVHDIHWSAEMEEAWAYIQGHPGVKMSIDIFSAGLIFFRDEFKVKQHFTIRF